MNNIKKNWRELLRDSVTSGDELARHIDIDIKEVDEVSGRYPMRINPYYLSLLKKDGTPLIRQAVPHRDELNASGLVADPLMEEEQSPVSGLIHRYPDRVIFFISSACAMYCRHCMRKRKVGYDSAQPDKVSIEDGLDYIQNHGKIRDVILSGGDPLLLLTEKLESILIRLKQIEHVEVIRIHSRVLCTLPRRITENLVGMLKKYPPLFINTHFNHPAEITEEAAAACTMLADAGIPLGNQAVLLKGVNDNPDTMKELMTKLIRLRVKPYYIHQADAVKGTCHFRTPVSTGLEIMKSLRGHISGICVPQYVIDLPGGGGKIPLLPEYIKQMGENELVVENFEGKTFKYKLG